MQNPRLKKQVSFSIYSPMEGDNWGEGVYIEGEPPPPPGTPDHGASWVRVSPGYFETLGTKIVEGRAINELDTPQTRAVALVNRFLEQKYFRDGHAIGKHFGDDLKQPGAFEIVGVTEDTNYWGSRSASSKHGTNAGVENRVRLLFENGFTHRAPPYPIRKLASLAARSVAPTAQQACS